MTLAVLARCSTLPEAEVMASALQSAGFHAEVLDRHWGSNIWTDQVYIGGFRVVLPEAELDEAIEVVRGVLTPQPRPQREPLRWSFWPLLFVCYFADCAAWGWPAWRRRPTALRTLAMALALVPSLIIISAMLLAGASALFSMGGGPF
jgi:hypothetical protein